MLAEDKILNYIKFNGPTLPTKVARNIGEDHLIASAYLSELVSKKKLKMTNFKIGSSPLYYLPGQEEQLINHASDLNSKDLNALHKLKDKKILQESELELIEKVSLRALKDFAIPLRVNFNNKQELFWKWFLLSDQETNERISANLSGQPYISPEQRQKEQPKKDVEEKIKETKKETHIHMYPPDTSKKQDKVQPKEAKVEPITEVKTKVEVEVKEGASEVVKEKKVVKEEKVATNEKPSEEKIKQPQDKKRDQEDEELKEKEQDVKDLVEKEVEVKKLKQEDKKEDKTKKEHQEKLSSEKGDKKSLVDKIKETFIGKKKKPAKPDEFLPVIQKFLNELDIKIESSEIIRKNKEIELIVMVPSVVGKVKYYCKVKNKKRCDERDLSAAYMEAQVKKLPLLFLYPHNINKKAQEYLESGTFNNIVMKKIDVEESYE